jgi:hypothetical protein
MDLRHRLSLRGTLAGAFLLLAGCGSPADPDVADAQRFDVSVSVSRSEVPLGETANVLIIATNPTLETLTFRSNSCVTVYAVLDLLGNELFRRPWFCNDIGLTHEVGPGEALEDTIPFDGHGPGSAIPGLPFDTLPPATYGIRGRVSGGVWSPGEPIRIRLLPRSP